jgi:hypothetical protein
MKTPHVSRETNILYVGIASTLFLFFVACLPMHAAAQSVSVQTQQLLPPGQNTCQQISVSDVEPHVFNGTLESFDLTVPNDYVSVLGAVGNTSIPLQYMTRWGANTGTVRLHIDTPTTRIEGTLPVSLTLLSALPGQPVCATVISFDVSALGTSSAGSAPVVPTIPVTPSSGGSTGTPVTVPVTTAGNGATGTVTGTTGGSGAGTSSAGTPLSGVGIGTPYTGGLVAAGVPITGLGKIGNICTNGNAYRLWIILLAIYLIIVITAIFAEPWFLEESVLGMTATILVPLILLLAFWYFSAGCRAAPWVPVLACVIGIVALFLAFREEETVILLPEKTS